MVIATEPLPTPRARLRLDASGRLTQQTCTLSVVAGPDAGKSCGLETVVRVGGQSQAQLQLSDPSVSRLHLELALEGGTVRLTDLQSTNGTWLNGRRIREATVELDGRPLELTVGRTRLCLTTQEVELGVEDSRDHFGGLFGQCPKMRRLFGMLERVAPTDSTVLLLGETGTGKDLIASVIHEHSNRRTQPFVVLDCTTIAGSLSESELFGHVRGAFTGAVQDHPGAFERAHSGTLFLDEIGELPLELQPKLLRVLEQQRVRRVGDSVDRAVDLRIIAATRRDLEAEVAQGRFRADLYYRLAVLMLQVPPLRERPGDVPLLAQAIVREHGGGELPISDELLARLATYHWPGNVRELRNVVERALALGELDLEAPDPDDGLRLPVDASLTFKEAKEQIFEAFSREYWRELAKRCDGNLSEMARQGQVARAHLYRLVKRWGLRVREDA